MKTIFKNIIKENQDFEVSNILSRNISNSIPLDINIIVSLIGARRSGKTTLLFEIIDHLLNKQKINRNNILFIKADDDRVDKKELINTSLDEYFRWKNPQGKIFIFIDEIHRKPDWDIDLKTLYDEHEIRIFFSGSSISLTAFITS